eukprot:CAMPEP_0194261270 /NCGR_PEP_ID=MMETSP0158-20130606/45937_1 /TAXON_ID=33649 /ORGANISM="Thalassionema nitzschioides, Strain L26-B" /LENGTH=1612 /DNA_ID=CAMNT_0039001387 /DNA_START=24 /DNA_END=4859 /DNA_ORIENTATION=-
MTITTNDTNDQHNNNKNDATTTTNNNDYSSKNYVDNDDLAWFQQFQERVALNIITDSTIVSPYSSTEIPLVYCDHTASNKPLHSVEQYVQQHCLGLYGNTHTPTSTTGSQCTSFVREARQVVGEFCHASVGSENNKGNRKDVVLFTPQGTTGAIQVLQDCLGLHYYSSAQVEEQYYYSAEKPILVLVGPYEHHSNLLPWRELEATVVEMIPEHQKGEMDLNYLEKRLQQVQNQYALVIGAFTAASNVTGQICPVQKVTDLLHRYQALAVWDYATAAPYGGFPSSSTDWDAMVWSPHKVLGGSQCGIGVLVVKQDLVSATNPPTHRNGGGTVFYVTSDHHRFLSKREERYEGGSPPVMGIVRLGLSLLYKRELEREYNLKHHNRETTSSSLWQESIRRHQQVVDYFQQQQQRRQAHNNNLILLGNINTSDCLPIFSFLIHHPSTGRFLHYNYVSAILNDVFGIQCRGGCQCAGPYSHAILGLSSEHSKQIEEIHLLKDKEEVYRPGYTRLSLPVLGLLPCEVEYVQSALLWVAQNGWALLCDYRIHHRTGEWHHYQRPKQSVLGKERRWLSHFNTKNNGNNNESSSLTIQRQRQRQEDDSVEEIQRRLQENLERANTIYETAIQNTVNIKQCLQIHIPDNNDDDSLRWFVHPQEVAQQLLLINNKRNKNGGGSSTDTASASLEIVGPIRPPNLIARMKKSLSLLDEDDDGGTKQQQQQQQPEEKGANTTTTTTTTNHDDDDDDSNSSSNNNNSQLEAQQQQNQQEELELVQFRDGVNTNHQGEATLEDIQMGIDNGELSPNCLVYVSDQWMTLDQAKKKNTANTDSKQEEAVMEKNHSSTLSSSILQQQQQQQDLFQFRDGNDHQGEATLEDIQMGIDDGELSPNCLVYVSDQWMTLDQAKKKNAANTDSKQEAEKKQQDLFQFRDGNDHQGEATLEDIQMGIDDGELSPNCLVYVSDQWMTLDQGKKKNTANTDSKQEEEEQAVVLEETSHSSTSDIAVPQHNNYDSSALYPFRDGNDHQGEATLKDIQMGIDDGELSSNCLVHFSNAWMTLEGIQQQQQQQTSTITTTTNDVEKARNDETKHHNTTAAAADQQVFRFRDDSENHHQGEEAGEATLEEIQRKMDHGKVSSDCMVHIVGTWMTMAQARTVNKWLTLAQQQQHHHQEQQEQNSTTLVITTKEEEATTTTTTITPLSAALQITIKEESNNKMVTTQPSVAPVKKGIRSCTEWGTGTPTILPTNNTNNTTKLASSSSNNSVKKKKTKYPHIRPPQKMMRLLYQAIYCFEMLADGDRLLLGLSGGKDSLSLLHALLELQRQLPIKFDLHVCTIDPQMKDSYDPSSLKEYMKTTFPNVPYHYMESDILARATTNNPTSLCSFCARMKRGILYATARQHKCNKLVLAQHLDDAAETFMMTLLHNGMLRTMKANYAVQQQDHDLFVIRPLIFCRERDMTNFAQQHLQPYLIHENCPACFEEPKERARMKKLLHREESLFPHFYDNIRTSLIPLMHDDMTAILRSYSDEIHAKGKKENNPIYQQRRRQQQEKNDYDDSSRKTTSDDSNDKEQLMAEGLSDETLLRELARRKANQYRLVGAMKSRSDNLQHQKGEEDVVCTK